jgi:hypothetical protein
VRSPACLCTCQDVHQWVLGPGDPLLRGRAAKVGQPHIPYQRFDLICNAQRTPKRIAPAIQTAQQTRLNSPTRAEHPNTHPPKQPQPPTRHRPTPVFGPSRTSTSTSPPRHATHRAPCSVLRFSGQPGPATGTAKRSSKTRRKRSGSTHTPEHPHHGINIWRLASSRETISDISISVYRRKPLP